MSAPGDAPAPRRRWPWIVSGLSLQVAGLGGLAAMLFRESRHDDPLHAITKYSLGLAWHDVLHQHRLVVVLLLCVIAYAAGAVLVAEPFVNDRRFLFIAVPIAAVASLVVLGLGAIIVAILSWLVAASDGDASGLFDGWPSGGSGRRRTSRRDRSPVEAPPAPDEP